MFSIIASTYNVGQIMKRYFLAVLILPLFISFAQAECFKIKKGGIEIKWKAFKTPAKVGVSGVLKKYIMTGALSGPSMKKIALQSSLVIETNSVFSNNSARDKKLYDFFFKTMVDGDKIQAKVKEFKSDEALLLEVKMSGVTKTIPMNVKMGRNDFRAKGTLDLFDFSMHSQLKSINKACFALHKGKTWNDVEIELIANFESCK